MGLLRDDWELEFRVSQGGLDGPGLLVSIGISVDVIRVGVLLDIAEDVGDGLAFGGVRGSETARVVGLSSLVIQELVGGIGICEVLIKHIFTHDEDVVSD